MDITSLSAIFSAKITFVSAIKFIAILSAAVIVAGILFRIILGRRSALNRAICAGIGVLCVYLLTIVVYTLNPQILGRFATPLPFVAFSGDVLYICPSSDFTGICGDILSLMILVLLYNVIDNLLPDGEHSVSWIIFRCITTIIAMIMHHLIAAMTNDYLPELFLSYGPIILLSCLLISLLSGLLGALLSFLMVVVNPVFGFIFHFFFSSGLGKQISKAMLTSGLLLVLVVTLRHLGYGVIGISTGALLSFIPLLLILIAVWWILERVF